MKSICILLLFSCAELVRTVPAPTIINSQPDATAKNNLIAEKYRPITFEYYYVNNGHSKLDVDQKSSLAKYLHNTFSFFEQTIQVKDNAGITINQGKQCSYSLSLSSCHANSLESELYMYQDCDCSTIQGTKPPRCDGEQGGSLMADMLVFISVEDTPNCADSVLAYAGECGPSHPITKRPMFAFINVCKKAFTESWDKEDKWTGTIKHEFTHAMLFSDRLMERFVDDKFNPISKGRVDDPSLGKDGHYIDGVSKVVELDWQTGPKVVKHRVVMVTTPKVKKAVQKYFNCPKAEGAEIENDGGSGTAWNHWEKRVYGDEVMSGVSTTFTRFSTITLSFFEDSGWYTVDYSKAEPMHYGEGKGCSFLQNSCLGYIKAIGAQSSYFPFCAVENEERCSVDLKAKLSCQLEYSTSPNNPHYDYKDETVFSGTGQGYPGNGGDIFDSCPYYAAFTSRSTGLSSHCNDPTNADRTGVNMGREVYAQNARCFEYGQGVTVVDGSSSVMHGAKTGCYETKCHKEMLSVRINGGSFYRCYKKGQRISIKRNLEGGIDLSFSIICPACEDVCGKCVPEEEPPGEIGDVSAARAVSVAVSLLLPALIFF